MRSSSSAHRLQKRECPHGTSASGAPWAQAVILRKLLVLQSLLAARPHQMSLTPTMTMVKSLPPVLHPHHTFQFLLMSSSCSVGRLSAMWLTADKNSYRLYMPAANLSVEVSMRLSLSIVAFFFARLIWRPCLLYSLFFLTVLRVHMTVTCILKSTRFT